MDAATLLVELLTDDDSRARYLAEPEGWLDEMDADDDARVYLQSISAERILAAARAQIVTRSLSVARALPRTRDRLGRAFDAHFERYARAHWPRGALRELDDAWGFARYLRRHAPDDLSGEDWALLEARRIFHHGRRISFGVSHHDDDGWFSCLSVVKIDDRPPTRLRIPLPVPAVVMRRLLWGNPGTPPDEE